METLEYPTIRLILGRRNGKCSCEIMDITEHPFDDTDDGDARITATACLGKTRGREGGREGGREKGQSPSKAV